MQKSHPKVVNPRDIGGERKKKKKKKNPNTKKKKKKSKKILHITSWVLDQNGISQLYIMLEIHHSGREPSITDWTEQARQIWVPGV